MPRYRFKRSREIILDANLTSAATLILLSTISALAEMALSVPIATNAINTPIIEAANTSTNVNPVFLKYIFFLSLCFNKHTRSVEHCIDRNTIRAVALGPTDGYIYQIKIINSLGLSDNFPVISRLKLLKLSFHLP